VAGTLAPKVRAMLAAHPGRAIEAHGVKWLIQIRPLVPGDELLERVMLSE
jgi:hypothetical protein